MTDEHINILKKLGDKVKELRLERSLTLKEMAYRIDKDPQSISRLEMGKINPSYLYLLDICKGLDIELTELINKKP